MKKLAATLNEKGYVWFNESETILLIERTDEILRITDGEAYAFASRKAGLRAPIDLEGVPSLEYRWDGSEPLDRIIDDAIKRLR